MGFTFVTAGHFGLLPCFPVEPRGPRPWQLPFAANRQIRRNRLSLSWWLDSLSHSQIRRLKGTEDNEGNEEQTAYHGIESVNLFTVWVSRIWLGDFV